MTERILFIAFAEEDGALERPMLQALGAARSLAAAAGAALTGGLVGGSPGGWATRIAASCDRVLGVQGEAFAVPRYATDVAAATAIARAVSATLVVAAGTSRASRSLPGLAQRLGGRIDTHVTTLGVQDGVVSIGRWYYKQRIEAVLTRSARPWVILVEPGAFGDTPARVGEGPPMELLPLHPDPRWTRTTVMGVQAPPADQQTIRPDADLLFVAGAGWTKKQADGRAHPNEAASLIREFLARSQASLGGSKSLVDLSGEGQATLPFMTHLNQVGQTGSTPRHPKGLATCCHGEEPHVVGWRFIPDRRAVNLDPGCGWAQGKADVLYVADAFAVVASLNELLRRRDDPR